LEEQHRHKVEQIKALDLLADQRTGIHTWLELYAEGVHIYSCVENPHARQGTELYNRFVTSWQMVENKAVRLVFHGTCEKNINSICETGLDPLLRKRQAYGTGEYFGGNPSVANSYCQGGRKMLVFAVIVDKIGITTDKGNIIVCHRPEHQLPLFVLTFDPESMQSLNRKQRRSLIRHNVVSRDMTTAVCRMLEDRGNASSHNGSDVDDDATVDQVVDANIQSLLGCVFLEDRAFLSQSKVEDVMGPGTLREHLHRRVQEQASCTSGVPLDTHELEILIMVEKLQILLDLRTGGALTEGEFLAAKQGLIHQENASSPARFF